MARKFIGGRAALAVLLALTLSPSAFAGKFLGDWCWYSQDCPRGDYCWLHYWAPAIYRVRACAVRPNLDQYPPGPCGPIPVGYIEQKYCCPYRAPAPSIPYADPAGYFARPLASTGTTANGGRTTPAELP
jgi:hypothetical protein